MTARFAIHISTKNRVDDLLLTLGKIAPMLGNNLECVVYDDGSTDGTSEAVQANFPRVTLKRNPESRGYIFCRNAMLNETTADYAISLDDDAHFLSENPTEIILNYFDQNPKCGLVAFRIFWGKQPPAKIETTETSHRVKGFVGCGHVWRMAAWRSIPPYPEWFEFYGEEQFAALQLFKTGWEVHYLPQILVHHRVDMEARKTMPGFALRYRRNLRNDWHLFWLFYPMKKIPGRIGYSLAMQGKKVLAGQFKVVWPVVRALADMVTSVPNYRKYRTPLTQSQWQTFMSLPGTKIYWFVEN